MSEEELKTIGWLSALDVKSEFEATNKEIILNLIENSISKEKIRKIHENTDNRYDFTEEILKLLEE